MIHLDTSILVDAFTGARRSAAALRLVVERGERLQVSTIVRYEWLRGPRRTDELADHEALFPGDEAVVFGPAEAAEAARLYKRVARARGREIDLAIAACAITRNATLWTLNREDFADIPGLTVYSITA